MMTIRPIRPKDLAALEEIQKLSPETPAWPAESYLKAICLVAVEAEGELPETVLGFASARQSAPPEAEILNIAVHPAARRRGIARALLAGLLQRLTGEVFLEVRASNLAAIQLYESLQFARVGIRPAYYSHPTEDGVVLRLQAC
ncbi:MAG: GNAT family N-acetyltransferase [Bryobacterales bacterium]|nr:GNAT family N-acetyltransferase [Bryobacterales bacterium]